ncbi:AraC family ligand binding domain-containing protein [Vacuolonema iberomarrocanum]|uniref:helix-turn-helix domain-containing protein n=1 Tax=Vacuolonema iberomarrocanum TaxID=3454632 RepID=UPI0019E426D9|nr:AraC family transcriptional regulator [filamentous cyanobacterium LEGE 07170]
MASMERAMAASETSKLWRVPRFGELELLRAQYRTQTFPRHTHDCYAIGVIEQGALGFFYRGENVVAARGDINLCIPGEVHTGHPAVTEGWSYRMFYLDVSLLERVASEMSDRPQNIPFFQSGVLTDGAIAQQLRQLHQQFEQSSESLLQQETEFLEVLATFIKRHADAPPSLAPIGQERRAVTQIKHYIESHYAEEISLSALAHLTHLSRYHLIRVFRETVGIPPHAYLRQVRIRHAKAMLADGLPIADVAIATGFTHQSHLNRWFKKLWGITPGQYRNCVQDRSA